MDKALVKDLSGQVLGSRKVFEEMRAEMVANKQDCMVFIHGFNVSFRQALQRCAQLKQFYGDRPMTWLVFTWPSDGSMLPFKAYASDRDDARASGVALGRGLQKLAGFLSGTRPEDYCGQNVHLMTHSMGGYALRWAFQSIAGNGGSLRRLLEHILMFAPDEDDDALRAAAQAAVPARHGPAPEPVPQRQRPGPGDQRRDQGQPRPPGRRRPAQRPRPARQGERGRLRASHQPQAGPPTATATTA